MNTKTFYAYKTDTGEYAGEARAFESPREPGVYHHAPNTVETAPPVAGEHEAACWNGAEWELRADYRGETYYDKATQEKHEITEISISPAPDWTDIEPTDAQAEWDEAESAWVVPFAVKKTRKSAEISAARYAEETGGVSISGMNIASDRDSQSLITGAALAATLDPAYTLQWKTLDGFVRLTAAQIIAVAQAVRAHVQACFDREAVLLPLVEAATTEAELDAIRWEE